MNLEDLPVMLSPSELAFIKQTLDKHKDWVTFDGLITIMIRYSIHAIKEGKLQVGV